MQDSSGQPTAFPAVPGVYAVYDAGNTLQYIGLSRKVPLLLDCPPLRAWGPCRIFTLMRVEGR